MEYDLISATYAAYNVTTTNGGAITGDGYLRPSADRVTAIESKVVFWAIIDSLLLVTILSGNILTILAVRFSRKLRSIISNLFILSLAISDMLVGFTLPYHLAFYLGSGLGCSRQWCLMRFFLIIIACCVSIWNLIAIAVDRYIAIVYPLHYSRYMTKKVALILISIGWLLAATIASVPLFWNNWYTAAQCEFDEVLPPWYMAGIITPIFSMVWFCLLILYWRIWREASKHAKQLRSSFTGLHEGPSDWKSVQVVLLILGCFTFCWLPYFIVACAQIFKFLEKSSPTLYKAAFSLAMANSGMNPIIYAWKNSNFRRAFGQLLRCQNPDTHDLSQILRKTNHISNRKTSSLTSTSGGGGGGGGGGHSSQITPQKLLSTNSSVIRNQIGSKNTNCNNNNNNNNSIVISNSNNSIETCDKIEQDPIRKYKILVNTNNDNNLNTLQNISTYSSTVPPSTTLSSTSPPNVDVNHSYSLNNIELVRSSIVLATITTQRPNSSSSLPSLTIPKNASGNTVPINSTTPTTTTIPILSVTVGSQQLVPKSNDSNQSNQNVNVGKSNVPVITTTSSLVTTTTTTTTTGNLIVNKLENLESQNQLLTAAITSWKNNETLRNKSIECVINENNNTIVCNIRNSYSNKF